MNNCVPPILSLDGSDYSEWKIAVNRWAKFTSYKKIQLASVVSVKSLSGEARSLALAIPDGDLDTDVGLGNLLKELDKLYMKDEDMLGYESWRKLITFKRNNKSVLEYCAEFQRLRRNAEKYKITMSDSLYSYILLDNCGVPEEQRSLILSIALSKVKSDGILQPTFIESALRRIDNSPKSVKDSNSECFELTD